MRTPTEWKRNLEKNIVTTKMLDAALLSANKRAKNCRDKKRSYQQYSCYGKYNIAGNYENKESEYYEKKKRLLAFLNPVCIHIEHMGFEKGTRVYDYENHFDDELVSSFCKGEICWSNSFVNYSEDYDFIDDFDNRTHFFDRTDFSHEKLQYYLFYELANHSYHTPIPKEEVQKHTLPVVHITQLNTKGEEINELCSVIFVDKIISLLESGNAILQIQDAGGSVKYGKSYDENEFTTNIKSNHIQFAIDYWGSYLYEKIEEKLKNQPINLISLTDAQKELVEKEKAIYAKELEQQVHNLAKSEESRLHDLELQIQTFKEIKTTTQKEIKKQRRALKNISRKLRKIRTISYSSKLKNQKDFQEKFWNHLFNFNTNCIYHAVDNINTVNELVNAYEQWINEPNKLSPYQEETIRKNYYYKNIKNLTDKYFYGVKKKSKELLALCQAVN